MTIVERGRVFFIEGKEQIVGGGDVLHSIELLARRDDDG